MKSTLRSFVVVTFTLIVVASSAAAQCVQCKPKNNCFICGPSTTGGCECHTVLCTDCIIGSPCTGICDASPSTATKVDEKTIMEIAQAHPRFAVGLALVNSVGGINGSAKLSSFPTDLRAIEVAHWVNLSLPQMPDETKTFFREFRKRTTRPKILTIEFTVTKIDDNHTVLRAIITNPFPNDPVATQLEIETDGDKVASWRVY